MESLGNELKSARAKRNISLETVSNETRISLKYLRCLEEGRYQDLPGGMYNRVFLRTYCEHLGLDPKPFLERYGSETASVSEKPQKSRAGVFQVSQSHGHPLILWSILLLFTIAGLYLTRGWITSVFSPYFSRPPAAEIARPAADQPAKVPPPGAADSRSASTGAGPDARPVEPAVPPAASLSQAAPPPNTAVVTADGARGARALSGQDAASQGVKSETVPSAPGKFRIEMQTVEECWASVTSDGLRVMASILQPGDARSFSGNERILIVLGNAAGVRLTINGQAARPLGKQGEVVRITIDEQSIPNLLGKTSG